MTPPSPPANRGLTLVEVLAVVVILGLLAATLTVSFSGSFGKAKTELARTGISQIVQKVELYRMDKGQYPSNDAGLSVLTTGQASPTAPFFIERDKLTDPWGSPYWFLTPGPDDYPFEVVSYGADGSAGGLGENADISSVNLRGSP